MIGVELPNSKATDTLGGEKEAAGRKVARVVAAVWQKPGLRIRWLEGTLALQTQVAPKSALVTIPFDAPRPL